VTAVEIVAPPGLTLGQARQQVLAAVTAAAGDDVRSIEVHPDDVPDWEWDCPCTFSVYTIVTGDADPYVLAFQHTHKADGYSRRVFTEAEHAKALQHELDVLADGPADAEAEAGDPEGE